MDQNTQTPVKLVAMLWRQPDMTFDQFVDHWLNHHGPLIRDTPSLARHILRYEQHVRHDEGPGSGVRGCDGVTIQWFAKIEDFWAFCSEPEYAELIAPDEARFLSIKDIQWVMVDNPVVVIGDNARLAPVEDGSDA